MKKIICILLVLLMTAELCGCAGVLNGEVYSETPHTEGDAETDETDIIDVSSVDELRDVVMQLVRDYRSSATLHLYDFDNVDAQKTVEEVCLSVAYGDPIGAYSVYYIREDVTRIVSYYEAQISISYKRTKAQVDSIVNVPNIRFFRAELESMMEVFTTYGVYYTALPALDEERVLSYAEQIYYENPLDIVMCPQIDVEIYEGEGGDKVLELQLEYPYSGYAMGLMSDRLGTRIQSVLESVSGESDAMLLLALCERMANLTEYDEEVAERGVYSLQDETATAYGALVNGRAVGEGYAMAYKALCDELGIGCYVVRGRRRGVDHMWNIVEIDGSHYHVDAAMCDINGMDTAFLKSDEDMQEDYWWELERYPDCDGDLNYWSVIPPPDEPVISVPDETPDGDTTDGTNEDDQASGEQTTEADETGEPEEQDVSDETDTGTGDAQDEP